MANANERLAEALEQAGYISDLPSDQARDIRQEIAAQGYVGALNHPVRLTSADAEDLTEGGIERWLHEDISPLLEARAIPLPPIENRFPEDASGYSVIVGAKEYQIWRASDEEANDWGHSLVAAFEIVNDILSSAGAPERLYAIGGGNDGQAWLLTPAQAKAIHDFSDGPLRELPYIPVNDGTEWFGQPH